MLRVSRNCVQWWRNLPGHKVLLLSPEPQKALPIGIQFAKEQISSSDWTLDLVYPILDLLSYIRTDQLLLHKCTE
ncbi:UNVERIFIED_CONTAM: hypothetical protein FKN15_057123 [Acipenser sinensis]